MIVEEARVVSVEPQKVWVAVERQTACSRCQAQSDCGNGLVEQWFTQPAILPIELEAGERTDRYALNSRVRLGLEESLFMRAVVVTYLLPTFALILGALLGAWIATVVGGEWQEPLFKDIACLLGAAGGLLLVLITNRLLGHRLSRQNVTYQKPFQPTIIEPSAGEPVKFYQAPPAL